MFGVWSNQDLAPLNKFQKGQGSQIEEIDRDEAERLFQKIKDTIIAIPKLFKTIGNLSFFAYNFNPGLLILLRALINGFPFLNFKIIFN